MITIPEVILNSGSIIIEDPLQPSSLTVSISLIDRAALHYDLKSGDLSSLTCKYLVQFIVANSVWRTSKIVCGSEDELIDKISDLVDFYGYDRARSEFKFLINRVNSFQPLPSFSVSQVPYANFRYGEMSEGSAKAVTAVWALDFNAKEAFSTSIWYNPLTKSMELDWSKSDKLKEEDVEFLKNGLKPYLFSMVQIIEQSLDFDSRDYCQDIAYNYFVEASEFSFDLEIKCLVGIDRKSNSINLAMTHIHVPDYRSTEYMTIIETFPILSYISQSLNAIFKNNTRGVYINTAERVEVGSAQIKEEAMCASEVFLANHTGYITVIFNPDTMLEFDSTIVIAGVSFV